jgi:inorganic pyrophosphatase
VPQTLWHDNDPLDVVLLTTYPLLPGILVRARPVAIINMLDSGEGDDKIIAVPVDDPRWSEVKDLSDINKHTLKEIEHFYSTYKKLQHKEVIVNGFKGRQAAEAAFTEGVTLYQKKFVI